MTRLENVSVEDLRGALEAADTKTETERLMVAMLYKRVGSVPTIAEWFDMRPATIYAWFDRFETEPIEDAARHRSRPGRESKLEEHQRERFEAVLRKPPTEAGYDATDWTAPLARDFLREEFGVDYTPRHVRRLLNDTNPP